MSELIRYNEGREQAPIISFNGLEPYEIKEIDGEFISYLPIAGAKDVKGKNSVTAYAEIKFASREEAFEAVAAAKEDLGLADKLN